MQKNQEKILKQMERRHKSETRNSRKIPSYIVALAMRQTFDDINKLECERKKHDSRSLSPSASITVNIDSKTTLTIPSESDSVDLYKEIKINIDGDENDEEEDTLNETDKNGTYNNIASDIETEEDPNKQPLILFDSSINKGRKIKNKKKKKNNRNIYFKNKNHKLTQKIQRYYTDKNPTVTQIQKELYEECLTKVVSRYSVLKNTLAKENLFEAVNEEANFSKLEQNSTETINEEANLNDLELEFNNESITSSSATTGKTLTSSTASQSTLVRKSVISASENCAIKSQISSNNSKILTNSTENTSKGTIDSDYSKSDTVISTSRHPSVIEIKSVSMFPYQSNIINVAVAVTETTTKRKIYDIAKENLKNHSLTSKTYNTFDVPSSELTSKEPSFDDYDESIGTLTAAISLRNSSDTTITVREKASNKSNDFSLSKAKAEQTTKHESDMLTSDPEIKLLDHSKILTNNWLECDANKTVKDNFGFVEKLHRTPADFIGSFAHHPRTNPRTDVQHLEAKPFNKRSKTDNNITVSEDNAAKKIANKIRRKSKRNACLFKKYNNTEGDTKRQKHLPSPNSLNEASLKTLIENAKTKLFSVEDLTKFGDITDLWENVTVVLDVMVQRLEHSIADKIIKEIKTISNSRHTTYESKSFGTDLKNDVVDKKEAITKETNFCHKNFQCVIIDNQILDSLMLNMSMDGAQIAPRFKPPIPKYIREPNLLINADYEELKAPGVLEEVTITRGSVTTTSTLADGVRGREQTRKRLKHIMKIPAAFVRENMFVITTVPSFVVFIFLMYFVFGVLVKLL